MDPQLQELARHIADDVERRLDGVIVRRLGEAEARLAEQFARAETRLTEQFAAAEIRLSEQFAGAETRLSEQFTGAETRLANGAKSHMEELREMPRLAAEGYGATLESIDRRLDRLELKVDNGFADHAKILRQHTVQINALVHQQSTRRSSRR
jgi:hypothetical protein